MAYISNHRKRTSVRFFFTLYFSPSFHKTIKNKLAVLENTYNAHDLFEPLKTLDEIMNHKIPTIAEVGVVGTHELITYVEESILEKQVVSINIDDKYQSIYPQSLVFLEGELSLIGENINDKTLFNIPLTNIKNLTDDDTDWTPNYSRIEVDDFIASIRAIGESEVRLVLKINGLSNFENSIPRNFLGNPAMVTNGEGDLIWGATIESNHEVFNWISDLGSDVEILDPIDFKKEYLEYLDNIRKLPFQKVAFFKYKNSIRLFLKKSIICNPNLSSQNLK